MIRAQNVKLVEITNIETGAALYTAELYGTSSDSKPTTGYANGSTFLEVDTGKIYLFNETTSAWVELQ